MNADKLLRKAEVINRVRLSASRIYALMAMGEFPRPIKIGVRNVAWKESEIDNWLASRSRGGPEPRHASQTTW